ncbi:hypothetical protein TSAR_016535 [Trichomalopsis sarcophagae]|uniref:Uncharacterized protein n=1 Tax=Trichomalopsis sarcophagae TaxID=543379 RepID=A0A232EDC5_9HYME|nr:hypothetical protein TSAR_016535 [Trichomalopsis sarcophagae]
MSTLDSETTTPSQVAPNITTLVFTMEKLLSSTKTGFKSRRNGVEKEQRGTLDTVKLAFREKVRKLKKRTIISKKKIRKKETIDSDKDGLNSNQNSEESDEGNEEKSDHDINDRTTNSKNNIENENYIIDAEKEGSDSDDEESTGRNDHKYDDNNSPKDNDQVFASYEKKMNEQEQDIKDDGSTTHEEIENEISN